METLESVNAVAGEFIDSLRITEAPIEVLQQVEKYLGNALSLLRPCEQPGPYSQALHEVEMGSFFNKELSHHKEMMPYSPVTGWFNPVSPRVEYHVDGKTLKGFCVFPVRFAGSPGALHGGMIAATLDEIMGMVTFLNGAGSYTGTLNVRYHKPTPILREVEMTAKIVKTEGRKVYCTGEILDSGVVTASAEAIFIQPALKPEIDDLEVTP